MVQYGRSPRPRVFGQAIAAIARVERAKLVTFSADDYLGLDDLVEVVASPR